MFRRPTVRGRLLLMTAIAGGAAPATVSQDGAVPAASDLVERAEVRLVQIDVSVIDPKSDSFQSIPGLIADQFEIRLDGASLTPGQRAALRFDPVCGSGADEPLRSIIAIVDLNYIDARGRVKVADAIDAVADAAGTRPELLKVYALTRQLRELTPGFTRDGEALRASATTIRSTAFQGERGDATAREILGRDASAAIDGLGSSQGGCSGPMSAAAALQAESLLFGYRATVPVSGMGLYSPEGTLAALKGILLAHASLPGRKAVLLFSSPRFRFPAVQSNRLEDALRSVLDLAQPGFTIWTVDVEGIAGGGSSELLSSLASDTGGRAVRNVGDLSTVFRGAAEQLSCYYLISLPLGTGAEAAAHTLRVSLDTERFRELWGLVVLSPSRVAIEGDATHQARRRLAALLSPDDFPRPAVAPVLDFPVEIRGKPVVFARFRVPLDELEWVPAADSGVSARLLVDAVVQTDRGDDLDTICEVGAESLGEIELRLPRPPPTGPRSGLAIELPCAYGRDGIYIARGAVTDLEGSTTGAARSTVVFSNGGRDEWTALAARVEAASGLDFVWRPGLDAPKRDTGRAVFRLVSEDRPADPGDRISLSYVLCGPRWGEAARRIRHLLLGTGAGGEQILVPLPPEALELAGADGPAPFCAQARVSIPAYTLEEGRYLFTIADAAADPGPLTEALRLDPAAEAEGLLGRAGFRVRP